MAGCVALAAAQLGWLAAAELAGDPIDRSFARRLLAFNESRLLAHPLSPGQVVSLNQAGSFNAPFALVSGWSTPEPQGVWSVAPEAVLLAAPPPPGPAGWRVVATLEANLGDDQEAEVGLSVDGTVLLRRQTATSAVTLMATVPADAPRARGLLSLGFLSRPRPPAAANKDTRMLGVSVKTVAFEPI